MENLLEFDLNELVSKQVMEKINSLEERINFYKSELSKRDEEISQLKIGNDNSIISNKLLSKIREEYSKITSTPEDKDGYGFISKQKNQFLFIENILLNFFNIKKDYGGWYCPRNYGRLETHLAVNFYSNKDILIDLLEILNPKLTDFFKISSSDFIKNFKMPFDYSKEDVIEYVKSPKYNTNNCIYGIHQYWMEGLAGKSNMPHDLIMMNPHILEEDVFDLLINSINNKVPNYYYLFALPKYNKNISEGQVVRMGRCLIDIDNKVISYDCVKEFIKNNLKKFDDETLEFFYKKMTSSNQFNLLHWENFPNHYQMKFLKSKNFGEIMTILNNYSCKWTMEEKENFLKDYLNN